MPDWLPSSDTLVGGLVLAVVQVLAALPWLRAIDPRGFGRTFLTREGLTTTALPIILFIAVATFAFLRYKGESSNAQFYGRIYGAVLHLQLLADFFILAPVALAWGWPKGGAVALAAYREGWRQPMFWLIAVVGVILTWVIVVLPYFTFGDDYKMMKQIGFDVIMLAGILFGVLAASISISEEIEGRTAVTLMSKPVNRRQFLVGKFLGILLAAAGLSLLLAWNLNWALLAQPEFDKINEDRAQAAETMSRGAGNVLIRQFDTLPPGPTRSVAEGAAKWFGETYAHSLFVLLGFGQVSILVAVATALATRLPFVVNLVVCLAVYFLGHLAPVVVKATERVGGPGGGAENGNAAVRLVQFLGRLFDAVLPGLEHFNGGPAIIRETPLELAAFGGYVLTVAGYAALYTVIALVVGLLLFEDRDLA